METDETVTAVAGFDVFVLRVVFTEMGFVTEETVGTISVAVLLSGVVSIVGVTMAGLALLGVFTLVIALAVPVSTWVGQVTVTTETSVLAVVSSMSAVDVTSAVDVAVTCTTDGFSDAFIGMLVVETVGIFDDVGILTSSFRSKSLFAASEYNSVDGDVTDPATSASVVITVPD